MQPSFLKILSTFVFFILVVGVLCRRRRSLHIPLMLSAILIDLGMVAYIEFTRDAVASAKSKMGPLMIVHLAFSISVLVFYAMQVYLGIKRWRGSTSPTHGKVMPWLLFVRFGNLVTSFFVA